MINNMRTKSKEPSEERERERERARGVENINHYSLYMLLILPLFKLLLNEGITIFKYSKSKALTCHVIWILLIKFVIYVRGMSITPRVLNIFPQRRE